MFANKQANHVPITPQQLLERPLEPRQAFAIDPEGTIEVDDAISVGFEETKGGHIAAHINTYIADTALLGADTDLFNEVARQGFTDYTGQRPEFMMPLDVLGQLSLSSAGEQGAPAVAIRTRIHKDRVTLTGIDRVRVGVKSTSYSQFNEIAKSGNNPEVRNIVTGSKLLRRLGYNATHNTDIDSHDIVARYMIVANAMLAEFALRNELPWIYRSHRGHYRTNKHGKPSHQAHYTHRHRLHRGVGNRVYCHGTSPLRRFPDFVDHLMLDAHLENQEYPFDTKEIRDLSISSNARMRQMLGTQVYTAA